MSKKSEEKTASNGPVIDAADEREQIIDPSDIGASKRYRKPTVDEVPAEKEALAEKDKGGESGTDEDEDEDGYIGDDDPPLMHEFLLPKELADRFMRKLLGEDRAPTGGRSLDSALDLLAPIAGQLLSRELSKEKPIVSFTESERQAMTRTVTACADLAHQLVKECMRVIAKDASEEAARQEARQQAAS